MARPAIKELKNVDSDIPSLSWALPDWLSIPGIPPVGLADVEVVPDIMAKFGLVLVGFGGLFD